VTRSDKYEMPAMARRNLHSTEQNGISSSSKLVDSASCQFFCNVRSQIVNGYSAFRNRFYNINGTQQDDQDYQTNLPESISTSGGTRFARTSSTSSSSGNRASGYNLRSRPLHSTPRGFDHDQEQQSSSEFQQGNQHENDVNADDDNNCDEEGDNDNKRKNFDQDDDTTVMYYFKKVLHLPIDIFDAFWNVLKVLPWWFLIPLLILFGLYTCKFLTILLKTIA
jgi:hypothetical protein